MRFLYSIMFLIFTDEDMKARSALLGIPVPPPR